METALQLAMARALQVEELATTSALQVVIVQLLFPTCIAEASPSPGFPRAMLNVERVKDNMQLAFIENLFTNRAIETNV